MATVNDADFRQSEKDWHTFVDKVTERLIEIDDTVPELPVKDVVSIHSTSTSLLRMSDLQWINIGTGLSHLPRCQV